MQRNANVVQLVEHQLPKLRVAGSSPVIRSNVENQCFALVGDKKTAQNRRSCHVSQTFVLQPFGGGPKGEKKMSASDNLGSLNYLPAQVKHNAHGWQVEYHALDPATGKLKRHVTKLNSLRKRYDRISDFRAHCNTIVNTINAKLAGGWTPFGEMQNTRLFTPINIVAEAYLKEKETEIRIDTLRSYKSFCKGLLEWCDVNFKNGQMALFNRVLAVRFLDHCFGDRNLHGRSWNNQLKQARAFFTWAVEKCYAKENPFSGIKPKREDVKKRVLVPPETRRQITEWCEKHNPGFLIVCELVYSALIRPKEVSNLRVGDVYLNEGYIHITTANAKTHYERFASITPEIVARLREYMVGGAPSDYVFGTGWKPGKNKLTANSFQKNWLKVRKAIGFPVEMQLYSLRDTGINEMLKIGIDPLTVMQHADHHDLSMTTRYANHADPHLQETISARAPKF